MYILAANAFVQSICDSIVHCRTYFEMNTFGNFFIIREIVLVLVFASFCYTQSPHCGYGTLNIQDTEADHIITPKIKPILNEPEDTPTVNILKNAFMEVNSRIYQMNLLVNQQIEGMIHRFNANTNSGICDHDNLPENWSGEKSDIYNTLNNINNIVEIMQSWNHATLMRAISHVKDLDSGKVPASTLHTLLQEFKNLVAITFPKVNKTYKDLENRLRKVFSASTDEVITNFNGIQNGDKLIAALQKSVKIIKNAEAQAVNDIHNTEVVVNGYVRKAELHAIHVVPPVLLSTD